MKRQTKLTAQEQEQLDARQQQAAAAAPREFASVEEMLRHDAQCTPVPPASARRLEKSVRDLPPPPARAWWRRFFGS